MTKLTEIELAPIHIYGILGATLVPLSTYQCTKEENRAEVIESILQELMETNTVYLGNTAIKTERFDGFRIL